MCVCVAVQKKNTYVHEFLILNANTVTCKHVFQLNFIAVCPSPSGQLAFAYIKAHPHCVACQSESRITRRLWQGKTKGLQRETANYQTHNASGLIKLNLCVSVSLTVCVGVGVSVFMFTIASAHFTWH